MINSYGPTESTVVSTWSEPLSPGGAPPIGRPIWNTRVYVLDDSAASGAGRGRRGAVRGRRGAGAWLPGPPGLTARAVSWPTRSGRPGPDVPDRGRGAVERGRGAGVPRTGGHQVKIRGFRIEPGEIETVLRRARRGRRGGRGRRVRTSPGDKRLVAYVVPPADRVPTAGELRTLLPRCCRSTWCPSAFVRAGRAAVEPQRQARPACAARAAHGHRGRDAATRGTADRHRAGSGRDLGRCAWVAAGRGRRRLLRARRRLDPQRPGAVPRPRTTFGADCPRVRCSTARTVAELAAAAARPRPPADRRRTPIRPCRATGRCRCPRPAAAVVPRRPDPGGTEYNTGVGLRLSGALDVDALGPRWPRWRPARVAAYHVRHGGRARRPGGRRHRAHTTARPSTCLRIGPRAGTGAREAARRGADPALRPRTRPADPGGCWCARPAMTTCCCSASTTS